MNRRGTTFLEVLVAVTLLIVAFLAVVGLFAQNLQLQARSAEMTESAEIGRGIMEQLKAQPGLIPDPTATFDKTTGQLAGPPPFPPDPFPTVQGEHGVYDITVKVEDAGPDYLKAVEVYVSWDRGRGVRLQTFFAE